MKHIGDTSNGLYKFLAFEAGAKNVTSINLIKECNPFSSLDFPVINWYIKECDVKSLYSYSCLFFPSDKSMCRSTCIKECYVNFLYLFSGLHQQPFEVCFEIPLWWTVCTFIDISTIECFLI